MTTRAHSSHATKMPLGQAKKKKKREEKNLSKQRTVEVFTVKQVHGGCADEAELLF